MKKWITGLMGMVALGGITGPCVGQGLLLWHDAA